MRFPITNCSVVYSKVNMNFGKQKCRAVGYQMDLPSCKITIYLGHGISRISEPSFKMNKQWRLIAKSKLKRYVHANNHKIKAFRDEQTLMGRNDRYN